MAKKIEITETELRGLIFWATTGIERMRGGSYSSTVDFIRNHYTMMNCDKSKYKKLDFGKRLE